MKISSCENPQIIRNKYTGILQQVPCGKCPSCQLLQGFEWKQRLVEESKLWKYVLFFTLTYDDKFLPTSTWLSYVVDSINSQSSFEDITDFKLKKSVFRHNVDTDKNGNQLLFYSNITNHEKEFINVYSQTCGKDSFPVLSKTHARRFIKVLRREIFRVFPEAEFRTYLIGEYGSCSFRPHYHGLFFTNNSDFCKEVVFPCSLANFISLSWSNMVLDNCEKYKFSLGITDCQKTDKSDRTMSYVSQYLSSITNLPQILRQKESAPFRICSKERSFGYVEGSFSSLCDRFYTGNSTRIIYDPKRNEHRVEVLPRTYRSRLFVEQRGFNSINVRHLGAWIVVVSLCRNVRDFINFLASYNVNHDHLSLSVILDCTRDEKLDERIKALYYSLTKSFNLCLEFGCLPCHYGFYHQNFYSKVQLFKLRQFYELQQKLSEDPSFDSRFLNCLYIDDDMLRKHPISDCDNLDFFGDFSNCPQYKSDRLHGLKILLNATKSKKRNDFLKNKEFTKFNFKSV